MQLPIVQAANNSNGPLLSVPIELMTKTFCLLPSFFDVLALAATCRRLRRIWTMNVTSIYCQVAPRSILCERYARSFLADQGGPAMDFPTLSTRDVLRIIRNSCVIEKAILQFEREIVRRVKTNGFAYKELEEYYGAGARKHPPSLTQTERLRFIRFYYQLWGMMKLDPTEWQSRLEPMTLKQLYRLYEMSKLTQSIGREEAVPAPRFPDAEPNSIHAINQGRSKEREALSETIWQHIEQIYQRIHHRDAELVWVHSLYEGSLGFIVMWDHWQSSLKQVVCGRRSVDSSPTPSFEKQYLWEDSTDEEM